MVEFKYDISDYEPKDFDLIPEGTYEAMIVNSEMCPNKANNGHYLKFEYKLTAEHAGRRVFDYINVSHPKEEVVRIGRQKLGELVHATLGKTDMQNTEQLHGIPLLLHIVIEGDYNRVKYVKGLKDKKITTSERPAWLK